MLHENTNRMNSRRGILRIGTLLALALVLAAAQFAGITTAHAAGGLNISTQYPGITVNPGEDVTFALNVENESATPQNVALAVGELPEGWDAYFEGDGNPVSRVYVDDASSDHNVAGVNLVIVIPDDAKAGDNSVTVTATGENGASDTLQLDVTLSDEKFTQGKLAAQYQEQQGSSSTTFNFSMALTNNNSKSQSYSLSASAPEGWQVSFYTSDGLQIASVNLEGNRSQAITVEIDPPVDVAAGEYKIPVTAVSPNESLSVDLTTVITGTYGMTLTTPTGLVSADAYAGKTSTVTLTIQNTGTADLHDISLVTATAPANWTVRYETAKIDTLAAGQSTEVVAYIDAASDAVNGDYVVSIKAKTSEATSQADFRVAVKTSTIWGIVGIVIVAAVVAALVLVFRKFGRR